MSLPSQELLQAINQELLKSMVVFFSDIFVTIPCNAAEHMVVLLANSSKQKSFLLRDHRDREILDTNKHYNRVDTRKAEKKLAKKSNDQTQAMKRLSHWFGRTGKKKIRSQDEE